MKISVSTGFYYNKTHLEILDMIKETSCRSIELFLNQAFVDVSFNELQREIEKRDLKVESIHTPLEFIVFPRRESEEFWINKSIDMAKVFDAKTIVTHMVYGEYFERLPGSLDELHKENILKYKDMDEVCVTTENMPYSSEGSFLSRQEEFLKFINDNDAKITFDTTHCAVGSSSIVDFFKRNKNKIKNIHLSDFKAGAEHKILGHGELPLHSFLSTLAEEKYEETLTIELDFENRQRNKVESLSQAAEEIEGSIEFIKKYTMK